MRLLALRKSGKLGVILAEAGVYYISDDPVDVWGHKVRYSKEELLALADHLERRPVGRQECSDVEDTDMKRSA